MGIISRNDENKRSFIEKQEELFKKLGIVTQFTEESRSIEVVVDNFEAVFKISSSIVKSSIKGLNGKSMFSDVMFSVAMQTIFSIQYTEEIRKKFKNEIDSLFEYFVSKCPNWVYDFLFFKYNENSWFSLFSSYIVSLDENKSLDMRDLNFHSGISLVGKPYKCFAVDDFTIMQYLKCMSFVSADYPIDFNFDIIERFYPCKESFDTLKLLLETNSLEFNFASYE